MQGTYSVPKQKQGLQAKEDSSAAPAASKAVVERHAAARAPSGKSLTALLQSRSEAMVPISERELAQGAPAVPDIDAKDHGDPLAASVYVRDIFSFYKRIEGTFRPSPDYMSRQVRPAEPSRAQPAGPAVIDVYTPADLYAYRLGTCDAALKCTCW